MIQKIKETLIIILLTSVGILKAQTEKPNIIVIMTDDMGYKDVGFNGCQDINTPNIDRIASNGVNFSNGYTSYSVCGPSRAGFMTGRYQQRYGFGRNPQYRPNDPNMGLPKEEKTLATKLKTAGYTSSIIGKWHLGAHISNHPLNRGFDEFYGHLGGGHRYFPNDLIYEDSYSLNNEADSYYSYIMRGHETETTNQYLTDEFSDEAVSFINKNKNNTFFLFLSYNAPHTPLQASEEYLNRYPNLTGKRQTYAAMVSAVDDGVGAILKELEDLNIDDNTLVFFLSDNGGPETHNFSDNGDLRGKKGDVYEGGFRVPFAMQWKGTIDGNQTCDAIVSSLDIFATATQLAGVNEDPQRPLDGSNLIPYLTNTTKAVPHETVYIKKDDADQYAIRHGDYKLITANNNKNKYLYDLKNDIGETNNIKDENPVIVYNLEAMRDAWDAGMIAPIFNGIVGEDEEEVNFDIKKVYGDTFENYSQNEDLINLNPVKYNSTANNSWTVDKNDGNGNYNSDQYAKSNEVANTRLNKKINGLKANKSYIFRVFTKVVGQDVAWKRNRTISVISGSHTYGETTITKPTENGWIETVLEFTVLNNLEDVTFKILKSQAGGNLLVDNFTIEENFNYFKNSDFELEDTDFWSDSNNKVTEAGEDVNRGKYAGVISKNKTGSLLQNINLKTQTTYVLSAWVKAENAGQSVKLIVKDKITANKTLNETINLNTTYTKIEYQFTTKWSKNSSTISLWKNNSSEGEVYVDDFELYEVGTSVEQARINKEDLSNLYLDIQYQANASIIPFAANLGVPIWTIENESGEASIANDGTLTLKKVGTFILKLSYTKKPEVSIEQQLTISPRTSQTYYVDASGGADTNDGSEQQPWKTLGKVNSLIYQPGDQILFKSGETWNGQLEIYSRGTLTYPVVFSSYGDGEKPILNGGGIKDYTVLISNAHDTKVSNFEITNKSVDGTREEGRCGVLVIANNTGSIYNTTIENLKIHNVNGKKSINSGGGIRYEIKGHVKSNFINLTIKDNAIYDTERNGIYGISAYDNSVLNENILIKNNTIEQVPGDAIILRSSKNGIVENNICSDFSGNLPNADTNGASGISVYQSKNTIIQRNEVSGHNAQLNGQAFYSGSSSNNTKIQYNYSHDNIGGFFMASSNDTHQKNDSNKNNTIRYNISSNDGFRTNGSEANFAPTIHLSGPVYNTNIYNNSFYIGAKPNGMENEIVHTNQGISGYPDKNHFYNNIFFSEEATKFTMSGSTNNEFNHNLYFGDIDLPMPADQNKIELDPLFVNPNAESNLSENYQLQNMSPASAGSGRFIEKNGGLDFFSNSISNSNNPGIGAHEFGTTLSNIDLEKNSVILFKFKGSNIVSDEIQIETKKNVSNATLTVISMSGAIVSKKHFKNLPKGNHSFILSNYQNGMYMIGIQSQNASQIKKFIKR